MKIKNRMLCKYKNYKKIRKMKLELEIQCHGLCICKIRKIKKQ